MGTACRSPAIIHCLKILLSVRYSAWATLSFLFFLEQCPVDGGQVVGVFYCSKMGMVQLDLPQLSQHPRVSMILRTSSCSTHVRFAKLP